jgi:ribonuclease HI
LKLKVYTDGACRGNPGRSAVAFVILGDKDQFLKEHSEYVGVGTNNEAEYKALISALKVAKNFGDELLCYSDSNLLVNQMSGEWAVKHPNIKPLWREAVALKEGFKRVMFKHVPRTNTYIQRVDQLANQTLDQHGKPAYKSSGNADYKQLKFPQKAVAPPTNSDRVNQNSGGPKGSFRIRLADGKILSVAVFPTKKDPNAEVISVRIQKDETENWEVVGKMAVYRSADGNYSKLPD